VSVPVSVIVPCYNSEKTIGKTLDSLKKQTFKDFELVVVDDASTDNSLKVIGNYDAKVISLKKNRGVSFARNRAAEAASGSLLLFIDADCQAEANWVEALVSGLREEGIGSVVGNLSIPSSTFFANAVAQLGFPGGGNAGFENMWPVSNQGFTNHIASGNFGIKRQVFEKLGGFEESLRRIQDTYLSLLLSKNKVKIKYCPDAVIFHQPVASFKDFVLQQLKRGKGNYHFKKKVGSINSFISQRLWSSKNILKKNLRTRYFLPVFFLLGLSFFLQQVGYLQSRLSPNLNDGQKK